MLQWPAQRAGSSKRTSCSMLRRQNLSLPPRSTPAWSCSERLWSEQIAKSLHAQPACMAKSVILQSRMIIQISLVQCNDEAYSKCCSHAFPLMSEQQKLQHGICAIGGCHHLHRVGILQSNHPAVLNWCFVVQRRCDSKCTCWACARGPQPAGVAASAFCCQCNDLLTRAPA